MKRIVTQLCTIALLCASSAVASASIVYNYDRSAGVFGGNSGLSYNGVSASYNTHSDEFTFSVDYNGTAAEGGWLVISPGPNPKNSITELGIAYFEASTGRTWVYAYNGQNNYASYLSMDFLGYFENSYTTNGSVATLTLDNSEFEGALETGFSFGERIGIWFHPSADLNVTGDSMGLSNFHARMNGWLDTNFDGNCNNPNNGCITAVPEPATLALVAMGFGLIGFSRRRQALAVR